MKFAPILPVFKDPQLQTEFEKNGFVVIPFYTAAEMETLENLYHNLHPTDEEGFFPSTFSKDKTYRNTVDERVKYIGQRSINHFFTDIKVVCGSFIVKSPGPNSEMGIHQDMTLVDESRFTGINIWCTLTDLTPQNGVLYILKGSHRIVPTLRGASIPDMYAAEEVKQAIRQYAQPLYLKAGEAVVFDQSIIHFSPPNMSEKPRIVTNIFITHKDATFRIVWWNEDSNNKAVEIFEEPDDFMTNYEQFGADIFARPKSGKSLGVVNYNFPKLSIAQLNELYGTPALPKSHFWSKWLQKLNKYVSANF